MWNIVFHYVESTPILVAYPAASLKTSVRQVATSDFKTHRQRRTSYDAPAISPSQLIDRCFRAARHLSRRPDFVSDGNGSLRGTIFGQHTARHHQPHRR